MERKKIKKIAGGFVTGILAAVLLALVIAFAVILAQIGQGKTPSLFGYRFYYVLTDSMTPNFNVGDVILSKKFNPDDVEKLAVGQVVTYTAESGEMKGRQITHRITEGVYFDEELNEYAIITKGDKQGARADDPVRIGAIEAVAVRKSGLLGGILRIFRNGAGFALVFVLPLAAMLVVLVIKLAIAIKSPVEKDKENAEKERIEAIRKKAVEEYIENEKVGKNDNAEIKK